MCSPEHEGEKRYNPNLRGAGKAWAIALGSIAAYDMLAEESLSNGFARARESEHPLKRAAVIGGLGYVAAHLMDVIPSKYDPLDRTIGAMRNLREKFFNQEQGDNYD